MALRMQQYYTARRFGVYLVYYIVWASIAAVSCVAISYLVGKS